MIAQISTVALFAGLAAAVHAPVGEPLGNPISAPVVEIVPACTAYTIKWTPTTPNTISIVLLRGPSTNVVPHGAPLAEGIANSGSFVWTPASSLEADTSRYGLQLIDDITGQYQYSTQFGISKELCEVEVSSSVVDPTPAEPTSEPSTTEAEGYGYPAETAEATTTEQAGYDHPISSSDCTTITYTSYVSHIASTGYPFSNSTIVHPTKSLSVPASLSTGVSGYPTGPAPPEFTGGASGIRAGLGLAGAVAGLVLML